MSNVQLKSVKTFTGLEWLVGEIESSLNAAFSELESFTRNTGDETKIRFCMGHLHQINGPFKILECEGCILLVEEMEALTQAIIDKKVSNIDEASEILVQAIVKLPIYLRQLLATREDRAETLILLLNDLRAAQGRPLVSEGVLFSPDLSFFETPAENQVPVDADPATGDLIKRLRQVYQLSLIKVIKEQEVEANWSNLKKVLLRMAELSRGGWREKLWHIAGQTLNLVASGDVGFSLALKKLFRALDTQLKIQARGVTSGEYDQPDLGLLKNLLCYLTTIEPQSAELSAIWNEYKLAEAFPSGTINPDYGRLMPQYDPQVVRSLVSAIQGELATVRSALERFSLEGGLSADEVRDTLPILANMSDSLALVGQGKLRDATSKVDQKLCKIFSAEGLGINDRDVAEAVQSLTQIELALNAWAASPDKFSGTVDLDSQQNQFEFDSASKALLYESRTGIDQVKEAVVGFINSHWDIQLLARVPGIFREMHGALSIIGLSRVAAVVAGCADYIDNMTAQDEHALDWHHLDTLADVITIVEYYLEQFDADAERELDEVLVAAEESICSLLNGLGALEDTSQTPMPDSNDAALHSRPEEIIDELVGLQIEEESRTDQLPEPECATEEQNDITQGKDLHAQRETPKADDEEFVDAEIIEIFVEEANEVLDSLNTLLPEWKGQLQSGELLAVVRRSFHTLKGSGRMVGATNIGELAWSIEDMFNRVIDGRVHCSEMMFDITVLAIKSLSTMIAAFAGSQSKFDCEQVAMIGEAIVETAGRLGTGEILDQFPDVLVEEMCPDRQPSQDVESEKQAQVVVSEGEDAEVDKRAKDASIDASKQSTQATIVALKPEDRVEDSEAQGEQQDDSQDDDHEAILLEIFVREAQSHLQTIDDFVVKAHTAAPLFKPPPLAVQRALHTLKGTAEMAGFFELSQLVSPLEEFIKELHHHHICIDEDVVYFVKDAVHFFRIILSRMTEGGSAQLDGLPLFRARLTELRERALGHILRGADSDRDGKDYSAVKRLMAEGLLALQNYPDLYGYLQRQTAPPRVIYQEFLSDLDAIAALEAEIEPIQQLAGLIGKIYNLLSEIGQIPAQDEIDTLKENHEKLLNLFDMLAADQDLKPLSEEESDRLTDIEQRLADTAAKKQQLTDLAVTQTPEPVTDKQAPAANAPIDESWQQSQNEPISELESELQEEDLLQPKEEKDAIPDQPKPEGEPLEIKLPVGEGNSRPLVDTELDPEIVAVFVEEADDIVSHIEELFGAWRISPEEMELADRLKRDLHTLKGGARMAGFSALGDQAHAIESLIDEADDYDKSFFNTMASHQQRLIGTYDIVRQIAEGGDIDLLREQLTHLDIGSGNGEVDEADSVVNFIHSLTAPEESEPRPAQRRKPADQNAVKSEIKEVIRIAADVLDTLVNLSGENIIFRGRVEEQLSEFGQFLEEMDSTIDRLQHQVRRLGTETEAQIDYRREQIEASGQQQDFDPLEMDRYSQLQQLTGSLMESASDLRDLKETLNDKLISTESLLLHQSRINTDLQEALMKTRMVPFVKIAPRLRRITRQVSAELKKEVEFRFDDVQGEIDRTVLDRLFICLEHMIRNALDHGIETKEERDQLGKPSVGNIVLASYRQGGEVIIQLADDGRGLNVEKIRRRALEKGLMSEDAALSAHEIAQFIFHPGFTTSDSVSQISGRGVGMDVVNSEVRQCGGRVEIETSAGEGTQFTIVLPFTLAVNRALMISVSGDLYALSLTSVDGVHFMPHSDIEDALRNGGVINYAGIDYELCCLGSLLNSEITSRPGELDSDAALVLFHSDNRHFAAQVDSVIGSREIVAKTLGPQFSGVPGLGGATILSDGQVVVIIDLNELARVALVDLPRPERVDGDGLLADSHAIVSIGAAPNILVVDDSVTVRKVTSRILRRNGYRVSTAKDGVEAMEMLQEQIPAVILLDIEMPRMDGFGVATRVRARDEWSKVPIIMITSRTGEKHRRRAMELGVDYYMGKPYQEDQLLETIDELLMAQS